MRGLSEEKHLEIEGRLEDILGDLEYDIVFLEEENQVRLEIMERIDKGGGYPVEALIIDVEHELGFISHGRSTPSRGKRQRSRPKQIRTTLILI